MILFFLLFIFSDATHAELAAMLGFWGGRCAVGHGSVDAVTGDCGYTSSLGVHRTRN